MNDNNAACTPKAVSNRLFGNLQRTKWSRFFFTAVGLLFVGGFITIASFHRFFYFHSAEYSNVGPWIFAFCLPLFAALFLRPKVREDLRARYPTRWVRALFMYPILVVFAAGTMAAGPLGWVIAMTWLNGESVSAMPGKIRSVSQYNPHTRGCDQNGVLQTHSFEMSTCLEGLVEHLPITAGQSVLISGRKSEFGFLVQKVALQ